MKILETKIEYQISPELSETLAAEQAILMATAFSCKSWMEKWTLPVCFGFFFAALFALGNYLPESKAVDFSWTNTITASIVGFAIGLFCGWFGQTFWVYAVMKKRLDHVKKQGRVFYEKLGPARVIFWDSESVTISSAVSRNEMKWSIINKFVNGENAVHAFIGHQIAFSIPKIALPQSVTAEALIKLWESHSLKS